MSGQVHTCCGAQLGREPGCLVAAKLQSVESQSGSQAPQRYPVTTSERARNHHPAANISAQLGAGLAVINEGELKLENFHFEIVSFTEPEVQGIAGPRESLYPPGQLPHAALCCCLAPAGSSAVLAVCGEVRGAATTDLAASVAIFHPTTLTL